MIWGIVGLFIGLILTYAYLKPQLKQTKELDKQIEEKNNIAYQTYNKITCDIVEAKTSLAELQIARGAENVKLESLKESLATIRENAEKTASTMQEAAMAVMQENFCDAIERERQHYIKATDDYQKEY